MKKMRRFAAFVAAMAMVGCMAVPMTGMFTASAASIKIENIGTEKHDFEVYQVFTGDLSGEGASQKLSNLKWGSGVTKYGDTSATVGEAVPDAVVTAMTGGDANAVVAKLTFGTPTTASSTGSELTIDGLADGYYVVKDVTNLDGKDDANSAWIVQVAGTATVSIKTDKPTIDKQVWDETTDAEAGHSEGWGESADHAINESFEFKLTATIPGDSEGIKEFDTYKLVFTDTMHAGVTFESIASVTVGGEAIAAEKYSYTATAGQVGGSWKLTIEDVKELVPSTLAWGTNDIEVVVTYKAHLNENCLKFKKSLENGDKTTVNYNSVYLEYSNNPDSIGTGTTGLGKTEEDTVWVYTYTIENTKVANEKGGEKLSGAKFNLLSGTTAIKFVDNKDGTYTVADQAATTGVTIDLISNAEGKFDIIGLDAGNYTLTEITPPVGYNKCADQTIVIGATHAEQNDGTVDMTLTDTSTMKNEVINKEGSTLPSTGGIGTTIFYVVGGTLVAGAGVSLIAKKRMKNVD